MAYGIEQPLPAARHIDVPSLSGFVASSAGFTALVVELAVRGWWGFATSGVELLVVDLHNNNQLCIPPCGCRKLCRWWSGGISVLVDESATAARFHDLEVSIWLV